MADDYSGYEYGIYDSPSYTPDYTPPPLTYTPMTELPAYTPPADIASPTFPSYTPPATYQVPETMPTVFPGLDTTLPQYTGVPAFIGSPANGSQYEVGGGRAPSGNVGNRGLPAVTGVPAALKGTVLPTPTGTLEAVQDRFIKMADTARATGDTETERFALMELGKLAAGERVLASQKELAEKTQPNPIWEVSKVAIGPIVSIAGLILQDAANRRSDRRQQEAADAIQRRYDAADLKQTELTEKNDQLLLAQHNESDAIAAQNEQIAYNAIQERKNFATKAWGMVSF